MVNLIWKTGYRRSINKLERISAEYDAKMKELLKLAK